MGHKENGHAVLTNKSRQPRDKWKKLKHARTIDSLEFSRHPILQVFGGFNEVKTVRLPQKTSTTYLYPPRLVEVMPV